MNVNIKYLFLALWPVLFSACNNPQNVGNEKPVARVMDSYLYPSDLARQVPDGLLDEDSALIAKRLMEEWIRDELLLRQAEVNLPENEKDVEKQVQEYRSSLLIYKYKQNLLSRNLDSLVTDDEIRSYYEENASNYILNEDVVKVNFVKLKKDAGEISSVRSWYRSEKEQQLSLLQEYCTKNNIDCIIDSQYWIRFSDLISRTPLKIDNPGRYLNYNKNIESSDSEYHYFIHIIDRIKEGNTAPLEMVSDDIASVLMNKRKIEYIQNLENDVYKEGLSRNQVEIY